jgi:hypothetical protein
MEYDDTYASCSDTHATVRIFSVDHTPAEISELLSVECTRSYLAGDRISSRTERLRETNAWFLSSEGAVGSLDCRRHFDWLLDQLEGCQAKIGDLIACDTTSDVVCYWVSAIGQGGPMFSPRHFTRFSALGLPLWFDIYCDTTNGG